MSFDFPNSPNNGQVFSPTGGPIYVYTGGVWRMQGSGQVVTAEARNRVVNPAFQISQENGNTALGPGGGLATFPADQWLGSSSMGGTLTQQRVQVATPNGSINRIRLTVNTADTALAAGEYAQWIQYIEGTRVADFRWGIAQARQVVLRFGFKGPAGTYTVSLVNGALNRSYPTNFTISAGQANVDTEQVIVIPGDIGGSWDTSTATGVGLRFNFGAGTTYSGTGSVWQAGNILSVTGSTNGVATAGAVYELFDVGLYLDPNATGVPPPWQMPDEAEELRACMRYYERTASYAMPSGVYGWGKFLAPKRVNPAITVISVQAGSGYTALPLPGAASDTAGGTTFYQTAAHSQASGAVVAGNSRM